MRFDRFEASEPPAAVAPLSIILPSTRLYYNQCRCTVNSGVPSLDNCVAIDRAGLPKYTELSRQQPSD